MERLANKLRKNGAIYFCLKNLGFSNDGSEYMHGKMYSYYNSTIIHIKIVNK